MPEALTPPVHESSPRSDAPESREGLRWAQSVIAIAALCAAAEFVLTTSRYLTGGNLSDLRIFQEIGRLMATDPQSSYSVHFYPPTALTFFWLLHQIRDLDVRTLWLHGSQALYFVCVVMTVRLLHGRWISTRAWAILLLFCISWPAYENIRYGQMNILILVLLLLHMECGLRGRPFFAGVFLGVACCLKPYPGILGIPLLLERRWTSVLGVFLTLGVAAVLPWVLTGTDFWSLYIHSGAGSTLTISGTPYDQSLRSFLLRLLDPGNRFVRSPLASPGLVYPLSLSVLAGSLAVGAWFARRRMREGSSSAVAPRPMTLWLQMLFFSLMLAISPNCQDFYFIWPLVPLAWMLFREDTPPLGSGQGVVLLVTAALLLLRLPYDHSFLQQGWWLLLSTPRLFAVWALTLLIARAGPAPIAATVLRQ